jgi:hypothetical protein
MRYLSHDDELAFADAVYPRATKRIRARWFCSAADHAEACCRAGARRLLMSAIRDHPSLTERPERPPAVVDRDRRRALRRCVWRALWDGSSRALAGVNVTNVLGPRNCCGECNCGCGADCPGDCMGATASQFVDRVALEYVARTSDSSEAVLAAIRLIRECSGPGSSLLDREAMCGKLIQRGFCSVAATVLAEDTRRLSSCATAANDEMAFAKAAWRTTWRVYYAGCDLWRKANKRRTDCLALAVSIRRFMAACRAAGMSSHAFVSSALSSESLDLKAVNTLLLYRNAEKDDTEWIADDAICRALNGASESGYVPGNWGSTPFETACWTNDAEKIATAEKHGPVPDALYDACFDHAIEAGHAVTAAYLSATHWHQVGPALGVIRDRRPTPMPIINWILASPPLPELEAARSFRHNLVLGADFLSDPACQDAFAELVERRIATRESLVQSVRRIVADDHACADVSWTPETIIWVAGLIGTTPADLFDRSGVYTSQCALCGTKAALYRTVAWSHPDWYTTAHAEELLSSGETEALDVLAVARPDIVDLAARAYASSAHWTATAVTARSRRAVLAGLRMWKGSCAREIGADYPRAIPWLERRGHAIEAVGRDVLLDIVTGHPGRDRTTADDVDYILRRYRECALVGSDQVAWHNALRSLSRAGFPTLALRLAEILDVLPDGDITHTEAVRELLYPAAVYI